MESDFKVAIYIVGEPISRYLENIGYDCQVLRCLWAVVQNKVAKV